jgi:putative ABC transport system permease protein
MQNMLSTMKSMIVLLILVAAILGTVIIYNLGIMSFSEKQYQFSTLKVLGFKDKQIRKIYVKQNTWLTIIAIILGLPLGYLMTSYIFTAALGDSYDFPAQISILSYLYAVIGTYLVSFIVNKFLAKKVNTIDMVTSLKGNE